MMMENRMYEGVKTWNPFKGCLFNCAYCVPSFQAQAKRQLHNCQDCYDYKPHKHEERLKRIPNAEIIFVAGNGDISFSPPDYTLKIIDSIKSHNQKRPDKEYYFQSKRPGYFDQFLSAFPNNIILVTTLETNRDNGYRKICKGPKPSERYRQFKKLSWPRKVVTIEPLLDFDLNIFSEWLISLNPEYVWIGYNSRPKQVILPEPSETKVKALMGKLQESGIKIKEKDLRAIYGQG